MLSALNPRGARPRHTIVTCCRSRWCGVWWAVLCLISVLFFSLPERFFISVFCFNSFPSRPSGSFSGSVFLRLLSVFFLGSFFNSFVSAFSYSQPPSSPSHSYSHSPPPLPPLTSTPLHSSLSSFFSTPTLNHHPQILISTPHPPPQTMSLASLSSSS